MTLATLSDVLQPALKNNYAVAGLVCLGWEDMVAYVRAAEAEQCPAILQAGPGCREHTPLPVLGNMFRYLAETVDVPIVAHLDHGYTIEECKLAIDSGFSSIMYDGSRKPLQQNIDETAAVVQLAKAAGISCEGEIGFVGYDGGEESHGTDPAEAAQFATETGVDAMAVSVGNVHLQQGEGAELDIERIRSIDNETSIPLVIHGGSGVPVAQRKQLASESSICKFNIGTELRMAFGSALRDAVNSDETRFDRNVIMKDTVDPVTEAARQVIRALSKPLSVEVGI